MGAVNNQNDLDDQLYILLATMKEYREAVESDRKRLERFYSEVSSGVLDKVEKSLQAQNKRSTDALGQRILQLDRSISHLDYKFILVYGVAFVALVMVLFLALFLFVPSLDEIKQRRAEVAQLKEYSLDLSKCEGKTCVRVIKKKCGYGKNGDYCVIDPK